MTIMYTSELYAVIFACFTYMVWNHSSFTRIPPLSSPADPTTVNSPSTSRLQEARLPRRGVTNHSPPVFENRGYVWMTVPKNYRSISSNSHYDTLVDVSLGLRLMMDLSTALSSDR
jgi:hypothetical protein